MSVGTYGIGHIALRVGDLTRARHFYVDTLGFRPLLEAEGVVSIAAHGLPIALLGRVDGAAVDRFDPFRVGLDHIALAVADASELDDLQRQRDAAGVLNNGVQTDAVSGATYISFYDPDGIAWELYAMPGGWQPA